MSHLVLCWQMTYVFGADDQGVLSQMVSLYQQFVVQLLQFKRYQTTKLRNLVLLLRPIRDDLFRVTDMVEKPKKEDAPSNLAIIGRYILTPDIFNLIRKTHTEKMVRYKLLMHFWHKQKKVCYGL